MPSKRSRPVKPFRRRERTLLLVAIGLVAVFGGIAIAAATWSVGRLEGSVDRLPGVFPAGDRPAPTQAGLTWLLVGLDRDSQPGQEGHAESIMLFHVAESRRNAQVISLPVYSQPSAGEPTLDGLFAAGGPPQLIDAVEDLTGTRVDHYAELDFTGFKTVTDALGGVTVDVPEAYSSGGYDFAAGPQQLNGDAALAYVRDSGRGGVMTSAERQQAMLQAVFVQMTRLGVLSDVGRLSSTLNSMAEAVRVDDTLDDTELVQLLWSLRRMSEPEFVTAPVAGTSVVDGQPVAAFDEARADALWRYLREDTLVRHLDEFR